MKFDGYDPISESLDPLSRWGTQFSFVDFPHEDKKYQIRLIAQYNNTEVRLTSGENDTVLMLRSGDTLAKSYSNVSTGVHSITSSGPISVMEISGGLVMNVVPYLTENTSSSMLIPVFQFNGLTPTYFINVWLIPDHYRYYFYLDGNPLTDWDFVGSDSFGHNIYQTECSDGLHEIKSNGSIFKMAMLYGITHRQAYAFHILPSL